MYPRSLSMSFGKSVPIALKPLMLRTDPKVLNGKSVVRLCSPDKVISFDIGFSCKCLASFSTILVRAKLNVRRMVCTFHRRKTAYPGQLLQLLVESDIGYTIQLGPAIERPKRLTFMPCSSVPVQSIALFPRRVCHLLRMSVRTRV